MQYGDSGGPGFISGYTFRCTGKHKDADAQAGLLEIFKANPNTLSYGWFNLIWFDPKVTGGLLEKIDRSSFYADLGLAVYRDGWQADNAAMLFKSGVPGGLKLNEYRNTNNYRYINVAHDDPDANMFEIYAHGGFVADNDRYAGDGKHLSTSHNTILVNGKGQKFEAAGWSQPLKDADADMTRLAHVTAYQHDGKVSVCEGEAAGSYVGLSRYRRTAIWVEGQYVLILDDIAADKESEITWLCQSAAIQKLEGSADRFKLGKTPATGDVQIAGDVPFTSEIGTSTALVHGGKKEMGLQQIQLKAKGTHLRLAAVFDVWNTGAKVTFTPSKDNAAVIVETKAGKDEWSWAPPKDEKSASTLTAKRSDGAAFELKSLTK
jgi:hypothetical protein